MNKCPQAETPPAPTDQRWFAYVQADPPGRIRLYCLPCASAGASMFRGWRNRLSPDVEVHPIQGPGRENRLSEAPYTSLDPFLDDLSPVLRTDRPYALLGHSTGALIAYGLARRLRELGAAPPERLFVVAYRAPHLPCHDQGIVKHQLDDDRFLAAVRDFQRTPEEVLRYPGMRQAFLPVLRADIGISETYRHRPAAPLDVPITAIGGTRDTLAKPKHLHAWQEHTSHPISVRMLDGDHFLLDGARDRVLATVRRELHRSG